MYQGINLASQPIGNRGLLRAVRVAVVSLVLLATSIHILWWLRAKQELVRTREDVEAMEVRLNLLLENETAARRTLGSGPEIVQWLVALERSGVTHAIDPTEILAAVDDALPMNARVVSLRIEGAPPDAEMTIEAVADDPRSVSDFVAGLSGSSCLLETEILEERHAYDGEITLRIGAKLSPRGVR
jgi:hypothetical protein